MSEPAAAHPIEGTWHVISAVLSGESAPEMVTRAMEVEIGRGKYCVRFNGQVADRGTLVVREEAEAARLELKGTHGANKGRAISALFQHKGDRLRVCYGLDGTVPGDFSSVAGSSRYLVFYRRKPSA